MNRVQWKNLKNMYIAIIFKRVFVFLKSEGGSLLEGIALGKVIRNLGFDTTIGYLDNYRNSQYSGMCASACAYTFAGGVARYIFQQ